MIPDDDETRLVRRDIDDETRLVRRDVVDDDTRFVRRDVNPDDDSVEPEDDQTRVVDRRSVDPETDQTRVVNRHSVDETRIVRAPIAPDSDESTRLRARGAGVAFDIDPDRTQLSTRPTGQTRHNAAPAASASRANPAGVPLGVAAGVLAGLSHPPDAPIGSTAIYGVRAPEPSAPIQRLELGADHPPVVLPATAEQIRQVSGTRARRRSVVAISVIVVATAIVAGAAIVAAIVILGL
ncbi:hypothetical protein GCM10022381_41510 [Leifsonia kafniensis]|uniref:Uncharacterized protein n=1 Tax=Leifsonia kafniensis TaxID=475957 RepID=A0ABP7L7I9_9MICO